MMRKPFPSCISHLFLSSVLAASYLACSSAAGADPIIFNDSSATYSPEYDISLNTGNSSITAKDVIFSRGFGINVNQPYQEQIGSLTISASDNVLFANRFSSAIERQTFAQQTSISAQERIDFQSGFRAQLIKETSDGYAITQSFSLNSGEINITSTAQYQAALELGLGVEGGAEVRNLQLGFAASADTISISSKAGAAIYADGAYYKPTDTEGLSVNLEASRSLKVAGAGLSYAGIYLDSIAVFATQGACVQLTGQDAAEISVTANQSDYVPGPGDISFGKGALVSSAAVIELKAGSKSRIDLTGGLYASGRSYDYPKKRKTYNQIN